jgi:hypothetical protein
LRIFIPFQIDSCAFGLDFDYSSIWGYDTTLLAALPIHQLTTCYRISIKSQMGTKRALERESLITFQGSGNNIKQDSLTDEQDLPQSG